MPTRAAPGSGRRRGRESRSRSKVPSTLAPVSLPGLLDSLNPSSFSGALLSSDNGGNTTQASVSAPLPSLLQQIALPGHIECADQQQADLESLPLYGIEIHDFLSIIGQEGFDFGNYSPNDVSASASTSTGLRQILEYQPRSQARFVVDAPVPPFLEHYPPPQSRPVLLHGQQSEPMLPMEFAGEVSYLNVPDDYYPFP
ncbi:hypothetical protein QFC20_003560 [Naganishia adeliensis]|uniref:Uncharacterized protein n=1 Tax=Naganishia adeliensis TaxID=92952 RepID=A0ACC2WC69_9TREE|nr:hypothetical protein QFC20_003560 [Naganishia adeliensis]